MAKYTTELRSICEYYAGYLEGQNYDQVSVVIEKALPKLFDFSFPIFDESYRTVLETKIVKHFYTREIGAETVGRWKLFLEERLNLIMPYYDKLYESEKIKFDPMHNVDLTRDHNIDTSGNSENTSHATGSGTSDNWTYNNDTPQGGIDGLADRKYLTSAINDTGSSSSTSDGNGTGTFSNTEKYVEHVVGKSEGASFSKLLKEYRDTLINIDERVIHELDDLFMGVW